MDLFYDGLKFRLAALVLFVFLTAVSSFSQPRYQAMQNFASLNKENFTLYQNYPNPFNPATTIKFSLKTKGNVSLKVFSILGREVSTLVNEEKVPGTYEFEFNAQNLPSGIYLYQLNVNGYIQTKRFILLK